ncbi:MAG TPA: hypothetical protein VN578_25230 [Candidatus Binatia bacterium]|nr:hypothetical protein [Candidatus Binatia bacterium]
MTNSVTTASKSGTNNLSAKDLTTGTNSTQTSAKTVTNSPPMKSSAKDTNSTSQETARNGIMPVNIPGSETNTLSAKNSAKLVTNSVAEQVSSKPASNLLAQADREKAAPRSGKGDTNSTPASGSKGNNRPSPAEIAMAGMNGMMGPGKKPLELPLPVQAQVVRVTESEILGPVMRPQPMALLGIAGDVAFLRSPSGQTGLVKAGDELGGLKLLRIGTNRVLVEQDGQKKELTIFNGLGSESLLPK